MIKKTKTLFFCRSCGAESPKWVGKCQSCGAWNTFEEEVVLASKPQPEDVWHVPQADSKPMPLGTENYHPEERFYLPDPELNRVLGGGVVRGSVVLLGGEPGIGKSTLLLQAMLHSALSCLYVSGEESRNQVELRAERIGVRNKACYMFPEHKLESVFKAAQELSPQIVVVDSIQTMQTQKLDSTPGTISQVKESTAMLIQFAKKTGVPVFIIGHINKEGSIAGPKVLEHMVDVVLQFEGEKNFFYRSLRALKNRFGSTGELGLYEMSKGGLMPVENPSEILITEVNESLSGVVIAASMDGNTPLIMEVQALVGPAVYGTPQRNTNGFPIKRLSMLLAVLEKRCGLMCSGKDVYINIAGGFKPDDPALDLAVVAAIVSSYLDISIPKNTAWAGEIGLSGEIRPVLKADARISESQKLGITHLVLSSYSKLADENPPLHLHKMNTLFDVLGHIKSYIEA